MKWLRDRLPQDTGLYALLLSMTCLGIFVAFQPVGP